MRTRDPDDKRRRLIAAGLDEFSRWGLAGARLDRIARTAQCSAGLLYSYFASKEALFDAVFASIVDRVVDEVPITADDLPDYAVRLRVAQRENPGEFRFVAWYELERGIGAYESDSGGAYEVKSAAIRSAQERGIVRADLSANRILALVLSLAQGYRGPQDGELEVIRDGVRRLVSPTSASSEA